jgi:hypothetical protein
MSRIDWLKLLIQFGNRKTRGRQILFLIIFEIYYQLCTLRGYRPRHFIEPLPDDVRKLSVGDRVLLIWPHLPLSIRLLDRVFPYGRYSHAKYVPYTIEAANAAKASGLHITTVYMVPGEFKVGS